MSRTDGCLERPKKKWGDLKSERGLMRQRNVYNKEDGLYGNVKYGYSTCIRKRKLSLY